MAIGETARLIASLELQDKFSRTANAAGASVDALERKTSTLGRIGGQVNSGLAATALNLTRFGLLAAGPVAAGIGLSIRAASDLNEEIDKSKVVFGDASAEVIKFADGAAKIGLSKAEALGAAGAFGNMFNTIGLAQEASADMSTTIVQLAADMASFNNEDPTEMLDKLRSGLAGEAEPLRRYGVFLSEATVKQEAYTTGIAESGAALTEAQKVQARYSLILKNTAIQQGNFADTSESLANKQRQLRANLQNTAATIGTALLPKLADLSGKLSTFLIDNQPAIQAFAASLPGAFDKLIEFGGNIPWGSIIEAFKVMGTGARILFDAFTGLPPWVQTAVITGWGLNKLTGGALGNIVGTLASGLIKGVLGITAGVVNINAATVNGGVGAAAGGRGALGGAVVGAVGTAGVAAAIGGGIVSLEDIASGTEKGIIKGASAILSGPGGLIGAAIGPPIQDLIDTITGQNGETTAAIENASTNASSIASGWSAKQLSAFAGLTNEQRAASSAARQTAQQTAGVVSSVNAARSAIGRGFSELGGVVRSSKNNLRVTVNVTSSIAISETLRRITSARVATGTISEF